MKVSLRIGAQALTYYVVTLVISLLFVLPVMGSALWLQIVLSLLLLLVYGWMLYGDGAMRGERAASLSVNIERQIKEGRTVDPVHQAQAYKPGVAWRGYLFGVLLLLVIALLNVVMEPFYPPFRPLTEEEKLQIEQIEQQGFQTIEGEFPEDLPEGELPEGAADMQAAVAAEEAPIASDEAASDEESTAVVNPFNIVARLAFMPYQMLYTPLENNAVVLNWLLLFLPLLIPMAQPIGYMRGPALRKRKLEMIEKGKKRKMRNLKVNKKQRQPKQPKMEV